MKFLFPALLLLGIAGALVAGPALSEEGEEAQPPQHDPEKMMELWQKYAAPGEHHARMGWYIGKWVVTSKMVMPGSPAQESEGSAEFAWQFEGRWLAQKYKGSMMGMPYEGFGLSGWDNFKQKYVMSWIDSMSTAMIHGEGVVCDPTGKTIVYWGQMDEWMTGEHDKVVKYVETRVDDDTFTFEIWDMAIGPEGAPVIHMTYKRQK